MIAQLRQLGFASAVLIAFGTAAPTASAAWTTTQTSIPSGANGGAARLSLNAHGRGVVDWSVDGPNGAPRSGIATIGADGAIGAATVTKGFRIAGDPAIGQKGRGLVLTGTGPSAFEINRLHWATVAKDGKVGRRSLLSSAPVFGEPVLVANQRGDAVATWTEVVPGDTLVFSVRVAFRKAGGPFGVSRRLLAGLDYDKAPAAAIDALGRVVVAYGGWDKGPRVVAWTGSVRRGLGPMTNIGPHVGRVDVAATFARGRAVVAWGTQRGGEEAASAYVVRAASQRADGTFSSAQVVDPGGPKLFPGGRVLLAPAGASSAVLAWNAASTGERGTPVRGAVMAADGRFGAVQRFAGGYRLGGLAVQPARAGDAAIAWAGWTDSGGGVVTARLPAGATLFGPAELAGPVPARPDTSVTPLTAEPPVPVFAGGNLLRIALASPASDGGDREGTLSVMTGVVGP